VEEVRALTQGILTLEVEAVEGVVVAAAAEELAVAAAAG
jgi:hypothetical protein